MAISGRRLEIGAVILAVMAFAVFLTFALMRLVEIERDTHSGSGEGIVWAVAQAQYEIQRLLSATTPSNAATQQEIELRVDVALSRLVLLKQGPMGQRIKDIGSSAVIERAYNDLLTAEQLIAQSQGNVENYSRRLGLLTRHYLDSLGSIANKLMVDSRIQDANRRARYSQTIVEVIVSILGIMFTGGFLIARLARSLRHAADAETRLRKEKNFLALLLESSGEGICAFDSALVCTHWNDGMARIFGRSSGDMLGKSLLAAGPDEALTPALLQTTLRGQTSYLPAQLTNTGAYIERVLCPIQLNGVTIGGIIVVRDVTERYDAQRERHLREIYRDFVSLVSHQFRTPLAVIDSSVQRMVRRGKQMDADELLNRATTIREATNGLALLMDRTLNAARIDAGEMTLSIRPVDLTSLIQQVRNRLLELDPKRQINLNFAELANPVACDALLIEQVLTNLIGNALKYSPAEFPVTINTTWEGNTSVVRVTDRGIGIPPEERSHIFERFFRASTANGFEGTGIGLYMSRQIVRLHGGDIEVAPGDADGTTFIMRLPGAVQNAGASA
jgi:PAS domain S-box-containing protein